MALVILHQSSDRPRNDPPHAMALTCWCLPEIVGPAETDNDEHIEECQCPPELSQ